MNEEISPGRNLLEGIIAHIRVMPNVWQKMTKEAQDDLIEVLSSQIKATLDYVVKTEATSGRTVIIGHLDQVVIKDGAKAVVKIPPGNQCLVELYAAQGKDVLVVVADSGVYETGMDEVRGEPEQRAFDMGSAEVVHDVPRLN